MEPYEKVTTKSRKAIMINNFLGGIFWALGTTVGLAVIVGLISLIGKYINFVPVVGSFITEIVNFVERSRGLQ